MTDHPWITLNDGGVLRCARCKEDCTLPSPIRAYMIVAIMNAFSLEHSGCAEPKGEPQPQVGTPLALQRFRGQP